MESEGNEKIFSSVIDEYDVIDDPVDKDSNSEIEAMPTDDTLQTETGPPSTHGLEAESEDQDDIDDGREPDNEDTHVKSMGGLLHHEDTAVYELLCPRVNCPEKIVICLDFSSEMERMLFRTRAGDKFAPLILLKRALGFFMQSKQQMDKKHEYALMLLQDSAIWVKDFTKNPKDIINLLDDLEETCACEKCDFSSVFQTLYDRVEMPFVEGDPTVLPPPYVVRMLIIYGRSHCPLELHQKEAQRALFSSPYFFVDAFYVHESPSEENQCEAIFDSLCDLDQKGFSYIFEASRNPTKIYDFMAQLLAHPLQRPGQKDANHKLRERTANE